MTIYRSHVPDLDLGEPAGLFTYAFRNSYLYNNDAPAFIDAVCDERYSRKELHDLCLRFAYGVKQKGVKRGEVAMVFRSVLSLKLRFPSTLLIYLFTTMAARTPWASQSPCSVWPQQA